MQPVRHRLYNRVIAHVFICYLSYLLLSLLGIKIKKKKINLSPIKALTELESVYRIYMKDEKRKLKVTRTVALSKVQENILKCVDKKLFVRCSG